MSQYDAHSISRATSLSRKSTVASRNASLIKKNTGPHELRPSDILIERFTGELATLLLATLLSADRPLVCVSMDGVYHPR